MTKSEYKISRAVTKGRHDTERKGKTVLAVGPAPSPCRPRPENLLEQDWIEAN